MIRHPLPGRLPPGERVLWQGAPDWRALARDALHIRGLALYFAVLVAWVGGSALWHGANPARAGLDLLTAAGAAAVPLAVIAVYSWLSARAATYTITNRRVVMRMGVAMPVSINLPFAQVNGAGLTGARDGTGNLPLQIAEGGRLSWLVLWPHVRPWRLRNPEPMLRALPGAERAGQILAKALAETLETPVPLAPEPRTVETAPRGRGETVAA